mgnify:CR=1 FL=1
MGNVKRQLFNEIEKLTIYRIKCSKDSRAESYLNNEITRISESIKLANSCGMDVLASSILDDIKNVYSICDKLI